MDDQGRIIVNSIIGDRDVVIKPFVHIKNSIIRNGCLIESFSYLYGCKLGENVKIMGNNHIPAGVLIDQESFIGPGVIFTNVRYPGNYFNKEEKRITRDWATVVGKNVTIGAGSVIGSGIEIGGGAFIGAGSVVTKDLPPFCLAYGNPARIIEVGEVRK